MLELDQERVGRVEPERGLERAVERRGVAGRVCEHRKLRVPDG